MARAYCPTAFDQSLVEQATKCQSTINSGLTGNGAAIATVPMAIRAVTMRGTSIFIFRFCNMKFRYVRFSKNGTILLHRAQVGQQYLYPVASRCGCPLFFVIARHLYGLISSPKAPLRL